MIFKIHSQKIDIDLIDAEREFSAMGTGTKPTARLLDRVIGWIEEKAGLKCSHSEAWMLWWAVYERLDVLRRRTIQNADIAFWFNVEPFSLSEDQRIGLIENLPRVQAQGILHHGNYNPTDYESAYKLTLLATGDEQRALEARAKAIERYVDSQPKGTQNA